MDKREKRSFSVFDVFLLVLLALAVSLTVYFRLENTYGVRNSDSVVYDLTLDGDLESWEMDLLPQAKDRLLDADGVSRGKVTSVESYVDDSGQGLRVRIRCEWEGELPVVQRQFRLETAKLAKDMAYKVNGAVEDRT